mmetsp:Transcript_23177/g.45213  ORF Transcript_23177/g.45213 Transcript_23177/m.45213 type:complete len:414 (-) Transcript_23177:251-1492(-)
MLEPIVSPNGDVCIVPRHKYHLMFLFVVEGVGVRPLLVPFAVQQIRPQRHGPCFNLGLVSLLLAVVEEGSKPHRIRVVRYRQQQVRVKLECSGELTKHLPHTVQPLDEDRADILIWCRFEVSKPLLELVTKAAPLLFDEDEETSYSAEIRVQAQFCQGDELCGSIPSVATVRHDAGLVHCHSPCHLVAGLQDTSDVLQPVAAFEFVRESSVRLSVRGQCCDASCLERTSDAVNVLDAHEFHLYVPVVGCFLVSLAQCQVRQSVFQRSCVVHNHLSSLVKLVYPVDEFLVAFVSGPLETHTRLAASPYGGVGVDIPPHESRDASPGSELGHGQQVLVGNGGRTHEASRVGVAQGVVFVFGADAEETVGETHPFVFLDRIVYAPPIPCPRNLSFEHLAFEILNPVLIGKAVYLHG